MAEMTMMEHLEFVGRNLAEIAAIIKDERGLEAQEIARQIDVTKERFSNWTRGKNYPDEYAMYLLHKKFGVTFDWIYRGDEANLPHWLARNIRRDRGARSN